MLEQNNSPRSYFGTSFFLLLLILSLSVQGQYAYSAADAKSIQKNRLAGQAAFRNTDRKAHYSIGLFFESIYKKYKDTSITAAVRHYKASVLSEGDIGVESQKAAFQLGRIYEAGKGVAVDYDKAVAYYHVSGELGKKYRAEIINRICPSDSVLSYVIGATGQQKDSVVVQFQPFCTLANANTIAALSNLASYLKANPHLNVKFTTSEPQELITNYYHNWARYEAGDRICQQVRHYLMDQGVSMQQFSYRCHKAQFSTTNFRLLIELVPEQDDN